MTAETSRLLSACFGFDSDVEDSGATRHDLAGYQGEGDQLVAPYGSVSSVVAAPKYGAASPRYTAPPQCSPCYAVQPRLS